MLHQSSKYRNYWGQMDKLVSAFPLPPYYYKEKQLLPPTPPESLFLFGAEFGVSKQLPDLEMEGITKLFTETTIEEFKRLSKVLFESFCALLDELNEDLEGHVLESKIVAIQTLLYNLHHILNSIRSREAQDNLIRLKKAQQIRFRTVSNDAQYLMQKFKKDLFALHFSIPDNLIVKRETSLKEKRIDDLWNEIRGL